MAIADQEADVRAREVSPEEGRAIFDEAARRYLGISGEEFLRRWDAGEYRGEADRPGVLDVAMLIPFGRR